MITNFKEDREMEEALKLFDKEVQAACRLKGIKNFDYLHNGFEFKYKGKTISITIKIKK